MRSQAERFAVQQNFIRHHLDCMNYLGRMGLELECIDEDWEFVSFRRIDRRVTYYPLEDGGLAVSYRPLKGKGL